MDSSVKLSINSQWKFFLYHCTQNAKQGLIDKIDCGVDIYLTQSSWKVINGLFLSSAVSNELDLRQRLENIKMYMKKMQPTFPWILCIEAELLPLDVRERLQEIWLLTEFVSIVKLKSMQTTELLPPVRPLPNVKVKFGTSYQDIYDVLLLNFQASNMDTSIAENVMDNHAFINDLNTTVCCIVLIDEKPVSATITVSHDKCLYVVLVVTSVQHRKRGYAEVALRASIERALEIFPHKEHGIVLHGTEIGRSMYERIGFKEVSDLDMFVHNPSASI